MPKTKTPAAKKTSSKKNASKKKSAPASKKIKATPPALSTEQRRKILKAREGYDELIERVALNWENTKTLRVPGLSVAKLRRLLRDAEQAAKKESAMKEKLERMLRPLSDKRLLAEEKAWRAVLDVNAAVKLFARSDPAMADVFAFLTEALTSNTGGPKGESSAPDSVQTADPARSPA